MFLHELTPYQQAFADEHHGLIRGFLNAKKLPFDDYYDVVVFGYLRAVRQYCSREDLQERFSFSTIAWRKMQDDLSKHLRKQSRLSRTTVIISLDSLIGGNEVYTLHEFISAPDRSMENLNANLLWDQMVDLLSEDQIEALRLRIDGYTNREIAARRKSRLKDIEDIFAGIQTVALDLCLI